MPMGWVAAAGLASAAIGAEASQSASGAQVGAANRATDATMGMFGQQQANLAPWMTEGKLALSDLGKFAGVTGGPGGVDMTAPGAQMFTPSSLFIDPSYDFLRKGQEEALLNNRSAMGGVFSGNTGRALTDYATGAASTEYGAAFNRWNTMINNIFSRLSGISGTGANTAGATAGLGMNAAGTAGENMIGAGNATAAGRVGTANALTGAGSNVANNYLLYSLMNRGNAPVDSSQWFNQDVAGGMQTG